MTESKIEPTLPTRLLLYLDNCCFNRPFDDQSQDKIRLESEAKLIIQGMIKAGKLALTWSFMLDFENKENPDEVKQTEIQKWSQIAIRTYLPDDRTETLSLKYVNLGLKNKDAVHLACATLIGCDYFITTDKGILRMANSINEVQIFNPVEFIIQFGDTL